MNFEKPDYKITEYVEDSHFGKFELNLWKEVLVLLSVMPLEE